MNATIDMAEFERHPLTDEEFLDPDGEPKARWYMWWQPYRPIDFGEEEWEE